MSAIARPADAGQICAHEVRSTPGSFVAALSGERPRAFCDIVAWDGEAAGLALWFYSFSTFEGLHGIDIEDLYVRPGHRSLGRALLGPLARRCMTNDLPHLQ